MRRSQARNTVSPVFGIQCFLRGISLAFTRDNLPFVIAPALTSLAVVSLGLYFAFSYVEDLSAYLVGTLPAWLSFLSAILEPLLYLFGILTGTWLFGFLAAIIGSIFLGDLALKIDGGDGTERPWYHDIWPALKREARKLRYHLPRLLALVVLSVIPLINAFAPLLWILFGAWLMAIQFCDFAVENRRMDFLETLAILRGRRMAALGFGACATFAMAIPLLNFLVAPVAVIGGTLLMRAHFDGEGRES